VQRAQGSVDWLERRNVFVLSTEKHNSIDEQSVRLLFKREFGSAGSWMSGKAVSRSHLLVPNAGVAMIRSKPRRSGSASLAVQKGKRGEYLEDDKGGEQTRGSNSLNSATHS